MLPTGHVEFTLAALNLLQRRLGVFPGANYRFVALVQGLAGWTLR